MINTDYSCDFFINFSEKFTNYINDKSNNIHLKRGFDIKFVYQNFESIFSKVEINSMFVSCGVNEKNVNDEFLKPIFKEIIEKIFEKITWFKEVHLATFINASKLHDYYYNKKIISKVLVKHLKFKHSHKNNFDFKYSYKKVLKEFFIEIAPFLNSKIEYNLINEEINRLKQLSLKNKDFMFLNDVVLIFRGVKFKDIKKEQVLRQKELNKRNKLKALQKVFKTIRPKWLIENNIDDFLRIITKGSIPEKESFLVKIPVQYFFYFLFVLEGNDIIDEKRIINLTNSNAFNHIDGKRINIEALNNAKNRFKSFDFFIEDNKKSNGCIKDLKAIYLSLNQ